MLTFMLVCMLLGSSRELLDASKPIIDTVNVVQEYTDINYKQ